jgi:uncharacterized membrane protein (DUF106 family)
MKATFRSPVTNHWLLAAAVAAALTGCGVETATTAATSAAIKKQEVEQGKKTMEAAQQKIEQANQQVQQQAEKTGADADKQ